MMSRSDAFPLVISLYPRESECIVCGTPLVACKRAIPVFEGEALPDSWTGEWAGFDACDRCADAQATITQPTPFRRLRDIDLDATQPPTPSRWRRMDPLDPIVQLYDDADCDSWHVPGRRTTGPCDPPWKGDCDREGCLLRSYGAGGGDCEASPVDTAPRCGLSGPYLTPCTYADCDLELGGGCVLRGPPA